MKKIFTIYFVLILFVLSACAVNHIQDVENQVLPEETLAPTKLTTPALTLEETADQVIHALAEKDFQAMATFVHPEMGLRFSPYAYVHEDHQVFMPEALPDLMVSPEIFIWGSFDGSGEPIEMTFNVYYERFVYAADFLNAEAVAVNERIGQGNSIDNIQEFYPGSSFVEYHFSGFDPQYGGMDWQSLRLVFLQEDGIWFLVGIVHDEWTI